MSKNNNLHNQVALGWASLLLVLVLMLVFMIVESVLMNDGFSSLREDPGRGGLRMMTYVVAIYALIPVLTYIIHPFKLAAARWLIVFFAGFNLIFMIMHHLSHWNAGQRPDFNSHVLDLVYHALSLWVIYCSIKWAKDTAKGDA